MCLSAFGALYFKIITLWLDRADLEYAKMKENSHYAFEMPLWEQNLNLKCGEQMILEFQNCHPFIVCDLLLSWDSTLTSKKKRAG